MNKGQQLTDEQIKQIENWSKRRKECKDITEQEKRAIEKVENLKSENWKGYRMSETDLMAKEEAQKKLDELSKKPKE